MIKNISFQAILKFNIKTMHHTLWTVFISIFGGMHLKTIRPLLRSKKYGQKTRNFIFPLITIKDIIPI